MSTFLDTPNIILRVKLIEEILKDIEHLKPETQRYILFSWISNDNLKKMHEIIHKDKY